ncbi:MAG: hypothetical protein COT18_10830, partial [Elusimicrobia bacterium CG08_land_8_20_14_0_20_59_10]
FNRLPGPALALWKFFFLKSHLERLLPFEENYNLAAATEIKRATSLPIITVGGLRSAAAMENCLSYGLDAVGLCRPLIRDPGLPGKFQRGDSSRSECSQCNLCTIYSDSEEPLKCRGRGKR